MFIKESIRYRFFCNLYLVCDVEEQGVKIRISHNNFELTLRQVKVSQDLLTFLKSQIFSIVNIKSLIERHSFIARALFLSVRENLTENA